VSQIAASLRAPDDGSDDVSLPDEPLRTKLVEELAREAAFWISMVACAAATKWRTGEPQETASGISISRTGNPAEEARAFRAGKNRIGNAT
jgi:hypothetical protein